MSSNLFIYLKGFIKGLAISAGYYALLFLCVLIAFQLQDPSTRQISTIIDARFYVLNVLYSLAIVYYFVRKHKLVHSWVIFSLFLGVLVIPFMMGNVELANTTSTKTRK